MIKYHQNSKRLQISNDLQQKHYHFKPYGRIPKTGPVILIPTLWQKLLQTKQHHEPHQQF